MKFINGICILLLCIATSQLQAQKNMPLSGNPIIKGWYAHPETAILKNSIGFTQPILINTTNRFFLMPPLHPIW